MKNLYEILKPDSYEFLLEQKKEGMNIILQYYNSFFPESKAKIIESIERGEIEDENLEDYTEAKKMNLRKEIIYSLLDDKNNKREKEIKYKNNNKWDPIPFQRNRDSSLSYNNYYKENNYINKKENKNKLTNDSIIIFQI